MSDRELLELAAKAAGIVGEWFDGDEPYSRGPGIEHWANYGPALTYAEIWNPLTDDGDALRLAVKMELHVFGSRIGCNIDDELFVDVVGCGMDVFAATRRAIVLAAAEIGRARP